MRRWARRLTRHWRGRPKMPGLERRLEFFCLRLLSSKRHYDPAFGFRHVLDALVESPDDVAAAAKASRGCRDDGRREIDALW